MVEAAGVGPYTRVGNAQVIDSGIPELASLPGLPNLLCGHCTAISQNAHNS